METSIHLMDSRWEMLAEERYREAYPELVTMFRHVLGRSFLRNHWIPDPLALDYLTKILIRFIPFQATQENIESALAYWDADVNDPRELVRYYETIGELVLWWSGVYHKTLYRSEGKRSYEIAFEQLQSIEEPKQRFVLSPGEETPVSSKRLKVNKMFSEQFEHYQEILERTDLLDDPEFRRYQTQFMTDGFSIN